MKPFNESFDKERFQPKENRPNIGKYSIVYHALTGIFDLNSSKTLLLALIISLSQNKDKCCYMSQKTMASLLGTSVTTINNVLEQLESDQLIGRVRGLSYKSICWRITDKVRVPLENIKYVVGEDRKNRSKDSRNLKE